MGRRADRHPLSRAAALLAVAAVYVAAGKLGLRFAIVNVSATAVWPPTGIALAALLVLGRSAWPAIFAGAFVVNLTTAGSVATSLGIAAGNTLEAVAGAALVTRFAGGRAAFDRARDVFAFIGLAGFVATAVSATIGVLSLSLDGYAAWRSFASIWVTWWLGDAGGALVVAPVLLLWSRRPALDTLARRWPEAVLLLAAVVGAALLLFGGMLPPAMRYAPIAFVCIPPLLWAAFRFGAREAATLIAVLSGIAVAGTLRGLGAFALASPNASLLLLQGFMATMVVAVLPVAALVWERRRADATLRESEERVRLATESGRMGTWQWRVATGEVTWSPSLEALHGLAPGAFPGTFEAFQADVHPEDRARVEAAIREALRTGEHHLEYRIVRPDGRTRWLEARGSVLYDGAQPERMLGICMDVTERKDAEARAAFFTEIARSLTSSLDLDTVLQRIVDGARALSRSDNAAIFLWDAEAGAMVPRYRVGSWLEIYGTLRIRPGEGLGGEVMRTRRPVRTESYATDPRVPATLRPLATATSSVAVMVVPILVGGEVTGLLYVSNRTARTFTDEDEGVCLRLAEQAAAAIQNARLFAEQHAARAEAEEANRAKDQFLAMLGHELRNPLSAIGSAAQVLALEDLGARAAHARGVIERQARHLGRLVDDLLDVSRVMSGKIELKPAPVDLADLVGRAVDALRVSPRGREHRVSLEASPVWTKADPTRVEQVVTNLLDNAAKYTPPGGTVDVTLREEAGQATLVVRDSGLGIAPELLPRVFDLFVQGDHSLDRAEGGLGLGLTLVRRLVELHGGAVEVASEGQGRGAAFTVRLPACAPAAAPAPVPAVAGGARRRVLVVEDNEDSREMLCLLLRALGHEVHDSADGPAGIEAALRLRPDLAVIDVGLPGLDGYEVARRLRQDLGPDLRLVALTGYGRPEDRERSRAAGFDVHLVKPVDPAALRALLEAE